MTGLFLVLYLGGHMAGSTGPLHGDMRTCQRDNAPMMEFLVDGLIKRADKQKKPFMVDGKALTANQVSARCEFHSAESLKHTANLAPMVDDDAAN